MNSISSVFIDRYNFFISSRSWIIKKLIDLLETYNKDSKLKYTSSGILLWKLIFDTFN